MIPQNPREWIVWSTAMVKVFIAAMAIISFVSSALENNEIQSLRKLVWSLCWMVFLLIVMEVLA